MTKLIYMEQMQLLECEAVILDIKTVDNDRYDVILDQTVFYPQGGGQPFDNGFIIKDCGVIFKVEEVRLFEGVVHHLGKFESDIFLIGDKVTCKVEKEKRDLHTRLHSAGHLIDMALFEFGKKWKPVKGYHFPNGAYVEYDFANDIIEDSFLVQLEKTCNDIIKSNIKTNIKFVNKDNMNEYCNFVPDYIPADKPSRVVLYSDFGIPCGGTHCDNLLDICGLVIRKIKKDKNILRISYDLVNM